VFFLNDVLGLYVGVLKLGFLICIEIVHSILLVWLLRFTLEETLYTQTAYSKSLPKIEEGN
jgi:hypothetical protein